MCGAVEKRLSARARNNAIERQAGGQHGIVALDGIIGALAENHVALAASRLGQHDFRLGHNYPVSGNNFHVALQPGVQ